MEGFSPPVRVLRVLCEQLADCKVIGDRVVVDTRPRSEAAELSEHELAMLTVFRTHGPLLSHADVRRDCLDAGLNDTTTMIYLGKQPYPYSCSRWRVLADRRDRESGCGGGNQQSCQTITSG
jgi:hypothetical protein